MYDKRPSGKYVEGGWRIIWEGKQLATASLKRWVWKSAWDSLPESGKAKARVLERYPDAHYNSPTGTIQVQTQVDKGIADVLVLGSGSIEEKAWLDADRRMK